MTQLTLTNIGKSYSAGVTVLENINLQIDTGELVVFVGPSGCGKSTLLRMIAGLESISSGELTIDGIRMNEMPPARRGIAMVFQSYALYPHMSVRDNMAFALEIAGQSRTDIDAAITRVAQSLKITELLNRLPRELSGGQRQRVAIGRSMVRNPMVYLFDEPLSNLDAALRVATRIEIAQLKESMPDSTMIYVTHDQVEAMTLASRIVVLANKVIAQTGTPLELYEKPRNEFVAQFIGSPAMNLLPGKIIETGRHTRVQLTQSSNSISTEIASHAEWLGADVNVGIRPEDLTPCTTENFAFEGRVTIAEGLGEVTQIYFGNTPTPTANNAIIAKLPGIHRDIRGQTLKMTADPAKIHLFMKGQSLLYQPH